MSLQKSCNVCQTEKSRYALSEGECEWSTHINTPQHFSVCCPVHVHSDPVSRHMLVSLHPHTRDHSSNALALGSSCAEKKARSHTLCSTVPSQAAGIPSPRSMLSCDKRLPPDTWNRSGSQENVFANPRSTLESSQISFRGIHPFATPSAAGEVPVHISTGAHVAREEERLGSTIAMPTPFFLWKFHRVLWLDSKDSRYRNFNVDKIPAPSSFVCWKIRFRNQATTCSDFPSEAMLWIKEVEMVIHWTN